MNAAQWASNAGVQINGNTRGHEYITQVAFTEAGVPEAEYKQALSTDDDPRSAYDEGVRWNDMPTPSGVLRANNAISMAADMKLTLKGFGVLVKAVHEGCLQTVHSMCPAELGKRNGKQIVMTNKQVRDNVVRFVQMVWKKILYLRQCYDNTNDAKKKKAALEWAKFNVAHIMHAAQDCFALGHSSRSWKEVTIDPNKGSMKCGEVLTYMGYDLQDSKKHGVPDHVAQYPAKGGGAGGGSKSWKDLPPRNKEMFQCSVAATTELVRAFQLVFPRAGAGDQIASTKEGASQVMPATYQVFATFAKVLAVEPGRLIKPAGGTTIAFAKNTKPNKCNEGSESETVTTPLPATLEGRATQCETEGGNPNGKNCDILTCNHPLNDNNKYGNGKYKKDTTPQEVCTPEGGSIPAELTDVLNYFSDYSACPVSIEGTTATWKMNPFGSVGAFLTDPASDVDTLLKASLQKHTASLSSKAPAAPAKPAWPDYLSNARDPKQFMENKCVGRMAVVTKKANGIGLRKDRALRIVQKKNQGRGTKLVLVWAKDTGKAMGPASSFQGEDGYDKIKNAGSYGITRGDIFKGELDLDAVKKVSQNTGFASWTLLLRARTCTATRVRLFLRKLTTLFVYCDCCMISTRRSFRRPTAGTPYDSRGSRRPAARTRIRRLETASRSRPTKVIQNPRSRNRGQKH